MTPYPVSGQPVDTPTPPASSGSWIPAPLHLAQMAALLVAFAALYWSVATNLVRDWANDGNYSHGFLIVPIALYFAWERRDRLRAQPLAPSNTGLLIVLASVAVLGAGTLGAELFLMRMSGIGVITGAIVFLFGWQHLRLLAFPVAFLVLMVPLPAIIFNQIAFPLQLVASQFGEVALATAGVPVLREGNVIVLAHTKLEVVEACSGIRSLVSLITLGIVYGYFIDQRPLVRVAIVLSTIPVAIVANGFRIAGTGLLAHFYGPEAAEGFFHEFSGWVVFVVAFAAIFGVRALIVSGITLAERLRPQGAHA
ncbi:MAG: exosortase/archaeosortase family protein [Acidimicrobiia bacterium]|nr:exosortase/archaeosortase family protein [Acidimicrobiia bacterium]